MLMFLTYFEASHILSLNFLHLFYRTSCYLLRSTDCRDIHTPSSCPTLNQYWSFRMTGSSLSGNGPIPSCLASLLTPSLNPLRTKVSFSCQAPPNPRVLLDRNRSAAQVQCYVAQICIFRSAQWYATVCCGRYFIEVCLLGSSFGFFQRFQQLIP